MCIECLAFAHFLQLAMISFAHFLRFQLLTFIQNPNQAQLVASSGRETTTVQMRCVLSGFFFSFLSNMNPVCTRKTMHF